MLNRIIRILGAALCSTLLLAGCWVKLHDPEHKPDGSIRFSAGSALLLDDATTKTSLDERTVFDQPSTDCFFVWGAKTVSAVRSTVFTGQQIILQSVGANALIAADDTWDYTDHRFWDSNASQYDFVALSGIPSTSNVTCNPAASGHVKAYITYEPTTAQYDILGAGGQRVAPGAGTISMDKVHLQFDHILSAVRVVVYNDSPSIDIDLNAYGFRNFCTRATGMVEQSGNGLASMGTENWSNPSYNSSMVLGSGTLSPATTLHQGLRECYPAAGNQNSSWDLMIPQDLTPFGAYVPQLLIDYEYDQENPRTGQMEHYNPTAILPLKDIKVKGSETLITKWQPGKKYVYEVHIRLGGGIHVNVSVTDWQNVPAETPGITI